MSPKTEKLSISADDLEFREITRAADTQTKRLLLNKEGVQTRLQRSRRCEAERNS